MVGSRRSLVRVGGALALSAALLAVGCSSAPTTTANTGTSGTTAGPSGTTAPAEVSATDKKDVVETYAKGVLASYDTMVTSATDLQTKIKAFTAAPSDTTLAAAQIEWLAARDDYGMTEVFRFYDGPIDDPEDGPEGQINAWPMDEVYVDYVDGDPTAGVINDPTGTPTITTEVLVEANEKGGETNISTGWHAIEFLLWGQDLSADGPGQRPVTDYTTAANAERRKTYLTLLADLLVDDLTGVRDAWSPDAEYRKTFEADPDKALAHIFRGMGALSVGELAGERISVALETKDQEDEHSCFSDNTANDVKANAAGIQHVYLATYPGSVEGMSPSELVAKVDPAIDTKLKAELADTEKLTTGYTETFEKMIQDPAGSPGNQALADTVTALETQGKSIAAAAAALGLDVSFEIE